MNKRQAYTSILWTLLLSSCAVGPDFVKPEAPTVKSYSQGEDPSEFGAQYLNPDKPIAADWWRDFASHDLNAVMEYGIEHSHTLEAARKMVERAQDLVTAQKGQLWPQLSLDAGAGRQKYGVALFGPIDVLIPPFTYYELGPSVNYLVDVFGVTRRTIEKQQALLDCQRQVYHATYLELTGKIMGTALKIATINAQIDVANDIVQETKKQLKLIDMSYELGAANKSQILSSRAQLEADESLLPGLLQQRVEALHELNELLGVNASEWTPPNFSFAHFKLPEELPLTLPSALVRTRPDILAAEAVLHAASADIGIATANLYPSITLSGNLMQEALTPGALFAPGATAFGYLGQLAAPLFTGGMLQAKRRAAVHAYELTFAGYQQIVVKSFLQVSDVLHALKHDEQNERIHQESVNTAKASLGLTRLSVQAGSKSTLTVLEAQRKYMQARLEYVKVKGKRYQDAVQLYLVLGGPQEIRSMDAPN